MKTRLSRPSSRRRTSSSRPHRARGGIRSAAGNATTESWWARRFLEGMERYAVDSRCSRGRTYARDGQVVHVEVHPGRISAAVQGGRVKPYLVELLVTPLSSEVWAQVATSLDGNPLIAARLLAGYLPEEVEMYVEEAGGSLFPNRLRHVRNRCECDDWSNPCKHVAAVYYVVGREFNRDPGLFLSFRGAGSHILPSEEPTTHQPSADEDCDSKDDAARSSVDPATFWAAPPIPTDLEGERPQPSESWNLLERLGPPPFWSARQPLAEALDPVLRAAERTALHILLGERDSRRSLKATHRRSRRSPSLSSDGESP